LQFCQQVILRPIIFSSRERRESGCSRVPTGFRRLREGACACACACFREVSRPTGTRELRSNVYSREMSFHVMSNAINVIDPSYVRSTLRRQHVSRVRHIHVHTSVRFQFQGMFFNTMFRYIWEGWPMRSNKLVSIAIRPRRHM
jgi:hypothetical protein